MKYILFGFIAVVLVGGGFATLHEANTMSVVYQRGVATSNSKSVPNNASEANPLAEQLETEVKEIIIEPGDTFSTIMDEVDVSASEQSSILVAVQGVYDFTKLQAGKLMHVAFAQDALASIDYDMSDDKKIVVENVNGDFIAKEKAIEYDVTETVRSATIESSLFIDGANSGLADKTLVELAEIFQWDIDFSTDIEVGDSFIVLYEERKTKAGEEASPGKILAAKFTNQGETYEAYYFETSSTTAGYYSADGESAERQFLSSPISVGYISSGFSYSRVNPVTKQVTPHRALDYAAPAGTPVVAIAAGTVSLASNSGGLGTTVEIEHGQYRSQYAHLSKIATGVKRGATVSQGEVVGYVGSTGISTGPHLQFAFFKDGVAINPLTADLPHGEALGEAELDNFRASVERYNARLKSSNE